MTTTTTARNNIVAAVSAARGATPEPSAMLAELAKLREENAKLKAAKPDRTPTVQATYADGFLTVRIPVAGEGHTSTTGKSLVFGTTAGKTGVIIEGVGELRVTATCYVKQ